MIAVYVLIALFVLMGILLLTGRGSFLIAGYNTASKEEKEKYDEKKLCRSMGVFLIVVSIIVSIIAYVDTDEFALKMLFPLIAAIIIEMIYANRCCMKKS